MSSALLASVAAATRGVHRSAGALLAVEVIRRSAARDPLTGNRGFAAPVAAEARIDGPALLEDEAEGYTTRARYRVWLYDVEIEPGDRIRFGGADHTVRKVDGILRSGTGAVFLARVTVD
ncbi:MAG: hypothetical protein OXU64_07580 [Gemmatimonadota bacterium]|nr:hypothetical protein [Gemmatimonadota bacterium]